MMPRRRGAGIATIAIAVLIINLPLLATGLVGELVNSLTKVVNGVTCALDKVGNILLNNPPACFTNQPSSDVITSIPETTPAVPTEAPIPPPETTASTILPTTLPLTSSEAPPSTLEPTSDTVPATATSPTLAPTESVAPATTPASDPIVPPGIPQPNIGGVIATVTTPQLELTSPTVDIGQLPSTLSVDVTLASITVSQAAESTKESASTAGETAAPDPIGQAIGNVPLTIPTVVSTPSITLPLTDPITIDPPIVPLTVPTVVSTPSITLPLTEPVTIDPPTSIEVAILETTVTTAANAETTQSATATSIDQSSPNPVQSTTAPASVAETATSLPICPPVARRERAGIPNANLPVPSGGSLPQAPCIPAELITQSTDSISTNADTAKTTACSGLRCLLNILPTSALIEPTVPSVPTVPSISAPIDTATTDGGLLSGISPDPLPDTITTPADIGIVAESTSAPPVTKKCTSLIECIAEKIIPTVPTPDLVTATESIAPTGGILGGDPIDLIPTTMQTATASVTEPTTSKDCGFLGLKCIGDNLIPTTATTEPITGTDASVTEPATTKNCGFLGLKCIGDNLIPTTATTEPITGTDASVTEPATTKNCGFLGLKCIGDNLIPTTAITEQITGTGQPPTTKQCNILLDPTCLLDPIIDPLIPTTESTQIATGTGSEPATTKKCGILDVKCNLDAVVENLIPSTATPDANATTQSPVTKECAPLDLSCILKPILNPPTQSTDPNATTNAPDGILGLGPAVGGIVGGVASVIPEIVDPLAGAVQSVVGTVVPAVLDPAGKVVDSLVTVVSGVVDPLASEIPVIGVVPEILATAAGAVDAVISDAPAVVKPIGDAVQGLATAVPVIIEPVVSLVPAVINGDIPGAVTAIQNVVPAVASAVPEIVDPLTAVVPVVLNTIVPDIIGPADIPAVVSELPTLPEVVTLVSDVPGVIDKVSTILPIPPVDTILPEIIDSVSTLLPKIEDKISTLIPEVIDSLSSQVPEIGVSNFVDTALPIKSTLIPELPISTLIPEIISDAPILSSLPPILDEVSTVIGKVQSEIPQLISTIVPEITDLPTLPPDISKLPLDDLSTLINDLPTLPPIEVATVINDLSTLIDLPTDLPKIQITTLPPIIDISSIQPEISTLPLVDELSTLINDIPTALPITTPPPIIQISTIQPNLDLSTLIPDSVISTLAPEISEIPALISTVESVITNIPEVISTPEPVITIDPTVIPITDPPILSTIAEIIPTLPPITTPELVTVPVTSMESSLAESSTITNSAELTTQMEMTSGQPSKSTSTQAEMTTESTIGQSLDSKTAPPVETIPTPTSTIPISIVATQMTTSTMESTLAQEIISSSESTESISTVQTAESLAESTNVKIDIELTSPVITSTGMPEIVVLTTESPSIAPSTEEMKAESSSSPEITFVITDPIPDPLTEPITDPVTSQRITVTPEQPPSSSEPIQSTEPPSSAPEIFTTPIIDIPTSFDETGGESSGKKFPSTAFAEELTAEMIVQDEPTTIADEANGFGQRTPKPTTLAIIEMPTPEMTTSFADEANGESNYKPTKAATEIPIDASTSMEPESGDEGGGQNVVTRKPTTIIETMATSTEADDGSGSNSNRKTTTDPSDEGFGFNSAKKSSTQEFAETSAIMLDTSEAPEAIPAMLEISAGPSPTADQGSSTNLGILSTSEELSTMAPVTVPIADPSTAEYFEQISTKQQTEPPVFESSTDQPVAPPEPPSSAVPPPAPDTPMIEETPVPEPPTPEPPVVRRWSGEPPPPEPPPPPKCDDVMTEWEHCNISECGPHITTRYRKPETLNDAFYKDCRKDNETKDCQNQPCSPLAPEMKVITEVTNHITCAWILATLAASILAAALIRSKKYLSIIQVNEDISLLLAHLLVYLIAQRDDAKFSRTTCKIGALGLQYFFMVNFGFQLIEALHIYTVLTHVVVGDEAFLGLKWAIALCWGVPIIATAATGSAAFDKLMGQHTCWVNFSDNVFLANFLPTLGLGFGTIILLEAVGGHRRFRPPNTENVISCKIARIGMAIAFSIQFASWFMGTAAVHLQNMLLLSALAGLNIAVGFCVLIYHFLSNNRVRAGAAHVFNRAKSKMWRRNVP